MLVAYYSFTESKITVFDDKKISKNKGWDKYLGKYNVIKLDVEDIFEDSNIKDGIKEIKKIIINEVKIFYQNFECDEKEGIKEIIKKIYKSTNRKIILIIDEWDLVLRNESRDTKSKNDYLKFLNKLIKNDENIVLTYMIGILPIRNYNLNSKFDIDFVEFSMITPGWMAKYIGFNKDEINELCKTHLANKMFNLSNKKQRLNNGSFIKIDKNEQISEKLSHKNDNEKVDDEVLYKAIDDFYNGYQLIDKYSDIKYEIYSPYSVIEAMKEEHIKNYQMINKNFLHEFVKNNFQNLKFVISLLIKQKSINIDTLKFQNDEISFEKRKSNLFLLVHYGYLGYNSSKNEIFIPNKEILKLFKILIESEIWKNLNKSFSEIFNPGENNYSEFFKNNYVVDKTELILNINKIIDSDITKNLCVTRPRRFGKTVTVNMLVAYYSFTESKITVFDDKKISKNKGWDKYLGKYNVILLNNLNYFLGKTVIEGIEIIKKSIIEDVKMYNKHFKCDENEDINEIIKKIYESTKRKIVLIIDEWDIIFRDPKKDESSKIEYIEYLTTLIKESNYIILTYMTGILPLKGYGINSSLKGVFDEFTMVSDNNFAKYVGFTEDDIKVLCEKYLSEKILENPYKIQSCNHKKENENKNIIETNRGMIKEWYNGYRLKDKNDRKEYNIYTPYSVIKAIENKKIDNYWINTETFSDLVDYIKFEIKELKENVVILMNKNELKIDINKYESNVNNVEYTNKDEVLTILVHLGYLAYDNEKGKIRIPNEEINKVFGEATKKVNYSAVFKIINDSKRLLEATWNKKAEKVAKSLENSHDQYSNKVYNTESTLQSTILNAYIFANAYYTLIPEADTGKGYADIIFIPFNKDKPAMVVELKYNSTTNTGIEQIKNRNYPARLEHYINNLLLICINYDNTAKSNSKNFKHHTCIIEKYDKNKN